VALCSIGKADGVLVCAAVFYKSVFSFLRQPLAFAAERRAAAPLLLGAR